MTPDTTKAKLITIVCAMELEARLSIGLKDLTSVKGYTVVHASGRGIHGPRTLGPIDGGNIRVEMLVARGQEQPVMTLLASFRGDPLVAFVQDVDAFPADAFL